MAERIRIVPARSKDEIEEASRLFTAYAEALCLDLSFQGFSSELAGLPGKYAPPDGELLLAYRIDLATPVGCVAFRPLPGRGNPTRCCEMKRLYVTPAARGLGVGKLLAAAAIDAAQMRDYDEMRLDTLPSMTAAREMYRAMGFVEIGAYYATPLEGTYFLSLDLARRRAAASDAAVERAAT